MQLKRALRALHTRQARLQRPCHVSIAMTRRCICGVQGESSHLRQFSHLLPNLEKILPQCAAVANAPSRGKEVVCKVAAGDEAQLPRLANGSRAHGDGLTVRRCSCSAQCLRARPKTARGWAARGYCPACISASTQSAYRSQQTGGGRGGDGRRETGDGTVGESHWRTAQSFCCGACSTYGTIFAMPALSACFWIEQM